MKITPRWLAIFVAVLLAVKPVADFSAALPDLALVVTVFGIAVALTIVAVMFGGVRQIEIPRPGSWFSPKRRKP